MSPTTFATKPLHPDFGVEIEGLDLDFCASDEGASAFARVRELFERHSLLLLREQHIDDERQLRFSRRFGPLERTKTGTLGTGSNLVILTNLDTNDEVVPPTDKQWLEGLGNQLWHSDSSFKPVPALASLLHAREIPPEGGETEFVSMRIAWRAMSPALRARVDGRFGIHDYAWSRSLISPTLMTDAERIELPPVRQPLVRVHPDTGEKGLYIGSHLASIEGMDFDEGRALIDELLAIATAPGRSYLHRWRPGDLLIWDNRFTMHRGRPYSPLARRRMVRTTVAGLPA